MIVFVRFWRSLRVINGVIVGTKHESDSRARYLKKKIATMKPLETENLSLKSNLDEANEENIRLKLLKDRLEEDEERFESEAQRLEAENARLKQEYLRLTIQHAR